MVKKDVSIKIKHGYHLVNKYYSAQSSEFRYTDNAHRQHEIRLEDSG